MAYVTITTIKLSACSDVYTDVEVIFVDEYPMSLEDKAEAEADAMFKRLKTPVYFTPSSTPIVDAEWDEIPF